MTQPVVTRERLLLGVILALGAAVRIGFYLSNPSLTIDETTLSLDLGARSFADLLHPPTSLQTGPVLFLWGVKVCTSVGGMSEYALRFVPLMAGLFVPYLVWRVGRRILTESAAILATALAAFAPSLIQYSVTVKPYITDALFALLLTQCTLDLLDRPDARRVWLRLGFVGLASILVSIPAPFLLAGVTAAVLLGTRPLTGGVVWRLAACLSVWGAAFLPIYTYLYRPVAVSEYMQQFWGPSSFAPSRPAGWWNLGRAVVLSLVGRPSPAAVIYSVDAYLATGLWMLLRRLPRASAALAGVPLLALLIVSALDRYPLAARLLIFAVPTFVWSLAAVSTSTTLRRSRIGWMLGGLAVLGLVGVNLAHPYRPSATRQAADSLLKLAAPGEAIYIASGGIPAWAFYTTDWATPDTGYLQWIERWAGRPGAAAFHNSPPRDHPVGPDEGSDLWTRRRGRVELLGLAPGIQWQEGRGFGLPVVPDSGWASREAARIRAAAAPTIWVMVAHPYPTTVRDLYRALVRAGGVLDLESAVGGVRLARFRFSAAAASAPAAARPS